MIRITRRLFAKPTPLAVVADRLFRRLSGQSHLPPMWLRDVGRSDFEATGREFLQLFKDLAGLKPDEQVLDIGCGSGRMALPLMDYLGREGGYTGADIVQPAIAWCQEHISAARPNFRFLHLDLYNPRYNPAGQARASDYKFPFGDQQFDFIFLTSVFTHMLADEVVNYLGEISRLLRPQGRSMMTFFLLNEQQQTLAGQKRNQIEFKYGSEGCRWFNQDIPEIAVAYEESYVRRLLAGQGLALAGPVYYGYWSGRPDGLSFQDILLVPPVQKNRLA
jgi:ubiquinone/menaquinone biosynthesis C-methylase UbiE